MLHLNWWINRIFFIKDEGLMDLLIGKLNGSTRKLSLILYRVLLKIIIALLIFINYGQSI